MGLLPDIENCRLHMPLECPERFFPNRLHRKLLVGDPGMHHGTDVLPQDLVKFRSRAIRVQTFFNLSGIWQASWQQRCRVACQISERYDYHNIQYRGFETLRDFGGKTSYRLVNRGPGAFHWLAWLLENKLNLTMWLHRWRHHHEI